jgi:hypothetical protein
MEYWAVLYNLQYSSQLLKRLLLDALPSELFLTVAPCHDNTPCPVQTSNGIGSPT